MKKWFLGFLAAAACAVAFADIEDNVPRVQYTASASQTDFDYPFEITAEADIAVYVDGVLQTLTTDYTVTGEGTDTGGTVTFTSGRTAGEIVTFVRDTAITRDTDFGQNSGLSSAAFNREYDKLFAITQELENKIGRAIRIPQTTAVDNADIELEPISNWTGKLVGIDDDGRPEPVTAVDLEGDTLTADLIGGILYPETSAESTAGATPTDLSHKNTPERYGAVADDGMDDTAALQAWASVQGVRRLPAGTYLANDRLTFAKNAVVIGEGSGLSKIDFSGADGTFTGSRAVDFSQGSLTALPATTGDPDEGDTQITFASAHGLAKGDIVVFHDDSSGSWSGHLSTYTAGEMAVVSEVVNTTTVNLNGPLFDGYSSSTTNAFKLDYGTVHMRGVGIIGVGSGSSVTTLFASHVAHSVFDDVVVSGGGTKATEIRYSYDVRFDGASYQYFSDSPGSAQNGLSLIHVQDVLARGNFQGERHAVVTGSTSGDGGIVNRGILISGNLKSLIRPAMDFHGNTEHSAFDGGVINGAVALGGDNNAVRNATIIGNSAISAGAVITFRELLGFNFELSNINGRTLANPIATGGTGVIDLAGNTTGVMDSNTTRNGTLRINNFHLDAPNATGGIRLVNRGSTADHDVVINGFSPRLGSVTSAFGWLRPEAVSGSSFRSVIWEGLSNPDQYPLALTFDATEATEFEFTPSIAFGGSSTGITYAYQIGRAYLDGDQVRVEIDILLTSKGAETGSATITGLPFTIKNVTNSGPPGSLAFAELAFSGIPQVRQLRNTATLGLFETATTGATSTITNADFEDTTAVRVNMTYRRE